MPYYFFFSFLFCEDEWIFIRKPEISRRVLDDAVDMIPSRNDRMLPIDSAIRYVCLILHFSPAIINWTVITSLFSTYGAKHL